MDYREQVYQSDMDHGHLYQKSCVEYHSVWAINSALLKNVRSAKARYAHCRVGPLIRRSSV